MSGVAVAAQIPDSKTYERLAPVLLMGGACLNGFAVHIAEQITSGTTSLTLGISPFQLITLLVAAKLSLGAGETERARPLVLDAALLGLLLLPSSAAAWAALAVYAGVMAFGVKGERRVGALLFLALALSALWSSVVLKWLAGPVTGAETFLAAQLLALFSPDVLRSGNVLAVSDAHSLIIMTACTSADALPALLLSVVSVTLVLGNADPRRLVIAAGAVAIAFFCFNTMRLAGMAWSGESYELIHGPTGKTAFDLVQTLCVLALGNWASRP